DHGDDVERAEDALDHDVHGDEHCRDHAALGEQEPPDEVHEGGPPGGSLSLGGFGHHCGLAHCANQMSTNAITAEATAHAPNIASVMRRDGMFLSRTLIRMIKPERLRNV